MSDSGGIQEEAPSFRVPVIILRNTTERQEILNSKQAILAGTNKNDIIKIFNSLIKDKKKYLSLRRKTSPFGDGTASKKIKFFLNKVL